MIPGSGDIEKVRKTMSFQEKYKDRIKVTTVNNYFIKNDKNNVGILTEGENVILKSSGKIDLNDLENFQQFAYLELIVQHHLMHF